MKEPVELVLYSKKDCPLCEKMEAAARALEGDLPLRLVRVDVTEDPALFARFGGDVPLLYMEGGCVAKHRVSATELAETVKRRLGLWPA